MVPIFNNPFHDDTSSTYMTFQPSYFKDQQPLESGVVLDIYEHDNGKNKTLVNAAFEYRGYLFACQGCEYTFRSPYADDITIMWFGQKAHAGWTRQNADIIQFLYGHKKPKDFKATIAAGTYYPIRVFWGNMGGPADLSLKIYVPDWRELYGQTSGNSASYLSTEACDGSYSALPPFGSEV